MILATQPLTLTDYLAYDDGTDTHYELVAGELVPMSLGSGLHGEIMHQLETQLEAEILRLALPWVARKGIIGVQSPQRGQWETIRIPDVTILPKAQWYDIRTREAIILVNQPPPLLVVEVVSPSTKSTYYRAKRTEYALLEIPEYWIVDALLEQVTVCQWVEGFYDPVVYQRGDRIESITFQDWPLSVEQILTP
jgi:Uma2 family endonuclease